MDSNQFHKTPELLDFLLEFGVLYDFVFACCSFLMKQKITFSFKQHSPQEFMSKLKTIEILETFICVEGVSLWFFRDDLVCGVFLPDHKTFFFFFSI